MCNKFHRALIGPMTAALLVGCGGGGGGDADTGRSDDAAKVVYNYTALNGEYTCSSSGVSIKLQTVFSESQLNVSSLVGSEVYKDKVGFLNGQPYYSRNTPLTANAETLFFNNGNLTIISGPAADVPDFLAQRPKSVTSCSKTGSATPPQSVGGEGLAALYGTLVLNYKFNGSSIEYTDSVNFSADSLSDDGETLSGLVKNSTNIIGCSVLNLGAYKYMCAIFMPDLTTELFLFNVSGGRVTDGVYEYCPTWQNQQSCAQAVIVSPDGVILTTSGVLEAERSVASGALQSSEAHWSKHSLKATEPKGGSLPLHEEATHQTIQKLLPRLAVSPAHALRK